MAEKWSQQQRDAIYDSGGTLLISAAAGSGKTSVLVERVYTLITNDKSPINADRLLIVTFTNAAAEEMRSRIAKRIDRAIRENTGNMHLKKQKLLIQRANICTIDSFCMQLVKDNFNRLDLPAEIGIIDNAALLEKRGTALAAVLEAMYKNKDFCAFASMFGKARNDSYAGECILALYDYLRSVPSPEKSLEYMTEMYNTQCDICDSPWGEVLIKSACDSVQSAVAMAESALIKIGANSILEGYRKTIDDDLYKLKLLQGRLKENVWDETYKFLSNLSFNNIGTVRGYEGEDKESVKALHAKIKDMAADLKKDIFICTQAEFLEDMARIKPMIKALQQAVLMFGEEFMRLKINDKQIEFSDFEHYALKLLSDENGNKTQLAKRISDMYDTVMVDEFQDTNEIQNTLYECLANMDKSNMFMVGDIKQSIYRFRKANPDIFIQKQESFARYSSEGGVHPATIILGNNYRSSRGVINGINYIFNQIMTKELGDIDYNDDQRLYPGLEDTSDEQAVEIHLIDSKDDAAQEKDTAYVAQLIKDMVDSKFMVREGSVSRPCQYGDFCILLRSAREKAQGYASQLERLNIPSYAQSDDNILLQNEVIPLIATLRVIDNPSQDVHLAASMLSPMFDFCPDDLAQARAKAPMGSLYGALLCSDDERIKQYLQLLTFWRRLAYTVPTDELCRDVLNRTGYFAGAGAMSLGELRRENLRSFTLFAKGYAQNGRGGLGGFIRFIDSALQGGTGSGSQGSQSAPSGVVQIMTIHRSKGLEFPICIVANCDKRFNEQDMRKNMLLHTRLGIGLNLRSEGNLIYPTVTQRAVKQRLQAENLSEEMRVLYVALTRAKDKLILTMANNNPPKLLHDIAEMVYSQSTVYDEGFAQKPKSYILSGWQSYMHWILSALILHPQCTELRKIAGCEKMPCANTKSNIKAVIGMPPASLIENAAAEYEITAQSDARLENEILQKFSEEYKWWQIASLPIKASVSSLSKREGAQHILKRPSFMYSSGLTAAERGSLLHSFLQYASFENAKNNLQGEITSLENGGYIKNSAALLEDSAKITAFLNSGVCLRMLSAQQILREYPFITAISAGEFDESIGAEFNDEKVMVQGIADCVIINGGECEIVDYKSDKNKTPQQFIESYKKQLFYYKNAIEKQLGLKAVKCTIYSLELCQEINVEL